MRYLQIKFTALAVLCPILCAQPLRKPFRAQSQSSISFSAANEEPAIDIVNVAYEVDGPIPGLPPEALQVLRKTTRSRQVLGDIGVEATTTIEAWPFAVELTEKPRYVIKVPGTDCQTVDNALLVVSRGLEEIDWWSVYGLGTGAHLFDSYVPLVRFSIARESDMLRYVGLRVPDDTADARLKEPHVVAVVTYASAERVIREALITAEDPRQAAQLRSFADEVREVAVDGRDPGRSLKISFSQAYPAAPATLTITIPIAGDDLDLAHATIPARVHVAAWKR